MQWETEHGKNFGMDVVYKGVENMSKRADKEWGKAWSRETEQDCHVALQVLATAVWSNWQREINSHNDYPRMVGLGNIHDLWNTMHDDMKAIYTLEQLVNNTYRTKGIETEEESEGEE